MHVSRLWCGSRTHPKVILIDPHDKSMLVIHTLDLSPQTTSIIIVSRIAMLSSNMHKFICQVDDVLNPYVEY